jgi:hypothetical protein
MKRNGGTEQFRLNYVNYTIIVLGNTNYASTPFYGANYDYRLNVSLPHKKKIKEKP